MDAVRYNNTRGMQAQNGEHLKSEQIEHMQFQRNISHKRGRTEIQRNNSQWEGQKYSMQLQNKSKTIKKIFPKQNNPEAGGQLATVFIKRPPLHTRDLIYPVTRSYQMNSPQSGALKESELHLELASAQKPKKKRRLATSELTITDKEPAKVESWTLSNITDQRRQFQKGRPEDMSMMKGKINLMNMEHQKGPSQSPLKNDRMHFQNQWGPIRYGEQMSPAEFQRDPSQMRSPAQQKLLKQFQNHSQTIKKKYPSNLAGQLSHMQFQRNNSQMSGQINLKYKNPEQMHLKNPMLFQKQWNLNKSGGQLATEPIELSPMRNKTDTAHLQHQKNVLGIGRERYVSSKMVGMPADLHPKQGLREAPKGTRRRRTTKWEQWIPPHLVTDEYYYDEGSTDDPNKKRGPDSMNDWKDNYKPGWHPSESKFATDAGGVAQPNRPEPTRIPTYAPRTQRVFVSLDGECDFHIYYCMDAYNTGQACGKTTFYKYYTFKNICEMDYTNCVEGYEVWTLVHMGHCFDPGRAEYYTWITYIYNHDLFLDKFYVMEPIRTGRE